MARDDIAGRIELRRRLDLSSYQAITQLAEEILEGADESQRQIIHAAIWVSLQLAEEPRYSVETSLDPQEPFVQISRSGKGRTNYQRDFYDVGKRQSELQHAQIAGERMDIGDGWKLHISIANKDRETMGLAWAVTANLLHEYGIPSAKVLRSDQLNRGDGGGKQITIYLGSTDLVQKYQLAIVPFVQALDTGLSEIIGLQALCDENNTILVPAGNAQLLNSSYISYSNDSGPDGKYIPAAQRQTPGLGNGFIAIFQQSLFMLNDDAIVSETDVDIFVVDPIVTSALDGISVGFDTDNLGSEANESGESSENHDDSACCTCFRFR